MNRPDPAARISPAAPDRMSPALALLFAVAAGAAVGNLYWAQPLLTTIAADLGAADATAGWLVTVTQLGYALGIALIVPLGDVVDRRRLVPAMMLAAAVALVLCAVAPSLGLLLVAMGLLGVCTVGGQLLTPLAGDLADDAHRGRVVGTVVSGLLTGIVVSRTVSGLVAGAAGWRSVYLAAAVLDVLLALLLLRRIPRLPARPPIRYAALLRSVVTVVREERAVRWILPVSGISFVLFTMFWTSLTFLLAGPPFGFGVAVIGLFGLAGLVGAVVAQQAGRVHDHGRTVPALGIGWGLTVLAFAIALLGGRSLVVLIIAIIAVSVAIQGIGILYQISLFSLSGGARSRLNTALVTNNFVGGAIGSAATTALWSVGGWTAVCVTGIALSVLGLVLWVIARRGPLAAIPSARAR